MSGLIGKVFGSSGSAKTDRTNQLKSFTDLNNVFNQGMDTSTHEMQHSDVNTDYAINSLGLSADYFKKILSGNRADTLAAVQPVTTAATNQSDAEKRQLEASGTARGGGTAGVNQQIEDKNRATTDTAIAAAKPGAAAGLSDVAGKVAGVGMSQLQAALSALGISESSAGNLGKLSGDAREADLQRQSEIGASIGKLALSSFGLLFGSDGKSS
jgi:hypothetical protein